MLGFETAIERVLGTEGGYTDGSNGDQETNWGIIWTTLYQAKGMKIVPMNTTIKKLTRDQAKIIYKRLFWDMLPASSLPYSVAFQLLDFAVNSGMSTAIRALQRTIEVLDDGFWGPISKARAAQVSAADMIMGLSAERLEFLSKLSKWDGFGRGWTRRVAKNLRYGAEDS